MAKKKKKCRVCKQTIEMMSQIGTGVCSENCRKTDLERSDPTINHGAGVTPRRGVGSTPTPRTDTTRF